MADEPERRPIAAPCCARLLLPLLRPLARLICHVLWSPVEETYPASKGQGLISLRPPTHSVSTGNRQLVPSSDQCRLAVPTPLEKNRGKTLLHARCAPWRLASDPSDATLPLPVAHTKRVPRSLSKGRKPVERPVPHTPPRPLHSLQCVSSSCRTSHARATMQPLLDTDGLRKRSAIPHTGYRQRPRTPHLHQANLHRQRDALTLQHCCCAPPALWVDCDATAAARHPHRGWTATPLLLRATRTVGGLRRHCCCTPPALWVDCDAAATAFQQNTAGWKRYLGSVPV